VSGARYPKSAKVRRSKAPASVWVRIDTRNGRLAGAGTDKIQLAKGCYSWDHLYEYCRSGRFLTREEADPGSEDE